MGSQQLDTGFSISRLLGLNGTQVEASKTNCRKNVLDKINTGFNDESAKRSERRKPSKRSKTSISEVGSKRYRTTFQKTQIDEMERIFLFNHYPDVVARSEMSSRTGLSEAQVQIWFQNRRAKWRKQQRKRRHVPMIFGAGYPSHLTRVCCGLDHNYFPYQYYNTDFWTCARQQVAALHFTSSSPSRALVPSPDRSSASGLEEPLV